MKNVAAGRGRGLSSASREPCGPRGRGGLLSSPRMRAALALLVFSLLGIGAALAASCKSDNATAADEVDGCAILFGNPNAQTGLGADQCRPECACGGPVFAPPEYDASFIQSL